MENRIMTCVLISEFQRYLKGEERKPGTIEKYLRDVNNFRIWLNGTPVTKDAVSGWKEHLQNTGYAPITINSMLSALNVFLRFAGWTDCRVKYFRIQRKSFRSAKKELTRNEYIRLLETAHSLGRERIALVMETICATGIRVSELRYITAEAARNGRTDIAMKGKIRTILLPSKLCRKLLKYAKKHKIQSGAIFLTKNGKHLSRTQIWTEMKAICKVAGVPASKVFPHNLRHLFARTFYKSCRSISQLADVLGHSSIETTRIYLISTGVEHAAQMNRLGLVT